MTREEVQQFIDSTEFPIKVDSRRNEGYQLNLYLGGDHVYTYDPVHEMRIEGDTLVIIGFTKYEYREPLEGFDELRVEPYDN